MSQSIPALIPESSARQDLQSHDIVEVIILACQLAPDLAEPTEPQPTSESGVPQPEAPAYQAPASSEATSAAPPAGSSQRVIIMINGVEVDITHTPVLLSWKLCPMICEKRL